VNQLQTKERVYKEKTTDQEVRFMNMYMNQPWLGNLPLQTSANAMQLVWRRGKYARAAWFLAHSLSSLAATTSRISSGCAAAYARDDNSGLTSSGALLEATISSNSLATYI
jgi:hypothetical protein